MLNEIVQLIQVDLKNKILPETLKRLLNLNKIYLNRYKKKGKHV